MNRIAPLACLLLLAACGEQRVTPAVPPAAPAPDEDAQLSAQHDRLATLEQRIEALAERIATTYGRGAYATGPSLSVDGQAGAGSLLQRLHELREELVQTRGDLRERMAELSDARDAVGSARGTIAEHEQQIELLEDHTRMLEMARSELWTRKRELQEFKLRLKASELERLHLEKTLYEIAADLLVLEPIETEKIRALQRRTREIVDAMGPPPTAAADEQDLQ
ncbi:MAG: hypothetical protein ACOCZK_00470 [Planctomycetota bacterium]